QNIQENSFYQFYSNVLDRLDQQFPELRENNTAMLKVLHAFSDKPPLVQALIDREILRGVILKKSSSEMQSPVADQIRGMLNEADVLFGRSMTTYGHSIELIRRNLGRGSVLIGDHGGYFSPILPKLSGSLGEQLVGVTEHTLNGEERFLLSNFHRIPYLSTARYDLKERSDREICTAIAKEVIRACLNSGKDLCSSNSNDVILLIGYGMMGLNTANQLKALGCKAEIVISDVREKRMVYAVQDGFPIIRDIREFLPAVDIVLLATNMIKGRNPVLTPEDFDLMKPGALISSMTSMDDEIDFTTLKARKVLSKVGNEQDSVVYRTQNGNDIHFMLDGRPANAALADGGSSVNMTLVEAAGIAGAYVLAHCHYQGKPAPKQLPDEISEMICQEWLNIFANLKLNRSHSPSM
ncbi:MAG: NAD(P)-dependent oxidoreductase, partial [Pseudomonadota bacterium]